MINAAQLRELIVLRNSKIWGDDVFDRMIWDIVVNVVQHGNDATMWNRKDVEFYQDKLEFLGFVIEYTDNPYFAFIKIP